MLAIFLIGLPGTGKSTFRNKHLGNFNVVSSDDYIESIAYAGQKTYDDVFDAFIKRATDAARDDLDYLVDNEDNMVIDFTNLSEASRQKRLVRLTPGYQVLNIYFPLPEFGEWTRRLQSRPGKTIPQTVLDSMAQSLQLPKHYVSPDDFETILYYFGQS